MEVARRTRDYSLRSSLQQGLIQVPTAHPLNPFAALEMFYPRLFTHGQLKIPLKITRTGLRSIHAAVANESHRF